MSKIEVNTVAPQCGTTLTLGESGDTVTLGSGASQSGFGRTGTVDWQTTPKTADFTAVNGEGYFVDTGGGAVIATLPASPAAGNIVYIIDYDGNFLTAACTVARNGSNIRGATDNIVLEKNNSGAVFIYVDATEGWQVFFDGSDADAAQTYISASGGTETTSGDFKIHTFTGPGTFTVSCVAESPTNNIVSYMVSAGGGGGGRNAGGGGGGGGFREYKGPADSYTASPLNGNPGGTAITVTAQAYPITVGSGGAGGDGGDAAIGSNSLFSTITSTGGGRAGGRDYTASGGNGASGGGAAGDNTSAGSGNTPPTTPAQGTNGGASSPGATGAGGGGATVVGTSTSPAQNGGAGGAGATTSITGSPVMYAAGGGGGGYPCSPAQFGGAGGGSGGGCGADTPGGGDNVNGTANKATGGGGGSNQAPRHPGSNGGSGIVIIRYKFQ